jgi:methyltransferase (TIGR00027 family)
VAAGRAIGLRDVSDPLALRFLPGPQRRLAGALRHVVASSPNAETVVNTLAAGGTAHAALRMDAIDRPLVATVHDVTQVVVVGAGFDTRAWRLDALRGRRVIEVDLPATQDYKRRRMDRVEPVADVTFAGADLETDDLRQVLERAGHDPSVPTWWIWEAVAVYLPRPAVEATLAALAARSVPGSRLAMTVAHPDLLGASPLPDVLAPVARGLFAGLGEPIRSTFDDDEVADLLATVGFALDGVTGSPDWARQRGRPAPLDLFAAERLALAGFPT